MKYRYLYFRILLSFLIGFIPLPGVERRIFDLLVRLQHDHYNVEKMALLEFDRIGLLNAHNRILNQRIEFKSVSSKPSDYPSWNDLVFATLFEKLAKAEPRMIIMTYPFPSTIDESRTQLTANAARGMPVVWASRLLLEGGVDYPPSSVVPYTNYGFGDFYPDYDGVLRHMELFKDGHVHLALRTLRDIGGSIDHLNFEEPQYIKFYSTIKTMPRLSLDQILFEPVDTWEKSVQGQVLFIGINATEVPPFKTPRGPFSRSEVHAAALANLLDPNGFIKPLPYLGHVLLLAIAVCLTIFITFKVSVSRAGAIVLLQGLGLFGLGWAVLDFFNVWISLGSPLFTILMTYALLAHYQLISQEDERIRAIQETLNLKKVDEMKNNYMSLFSHDLKTPISKIEGICERILKTPEGADVPSSIRSEFEKIEQSSLELKTYIRDILNLTKIESQDFRTQKVVCDINMILDSVLEKMKPLADAKNIQMTANLDPLFTMELDETLVREIFQNIIQNSIHYCPNGSFIDVRSQEDGRDVVVTFTDNGPGISEDELPHVTERFFRGKSALSMGKGSGLGLYLVKYFTELHGGKFKITSQFGHGTKIEIRFPLI